MKIPVLNSYNPYLEKTAESLQSNGSVGTTGSSSQKSASSQDLNHGTSDSLVSRRERDFFIRMFPDNSDQLERHVIFNRTGKIQSHNLVKGTIIDGRV